MTFVRTATTVGAATLLATSGCGPEPPTTPEPEPSSWETPEPLPLDPGRVTLHRLNNIGFQNTVQELLGTELALGHTTTWESPRPTTRCRTTTTTPSP